MIDGVEVDVDREAVIVRAATPLAVMSSAVVGGGLGRASAIVNVHVPKDFHGEHAERVLAGFVARRQIVGPWVGLLTGAWTEKAEVATETIDAITAMAVVTVGLSHPSSAGRSPVAGCWLASTINTIVVVDAAPEPAALVNLVMTVAEAKAMAVTEARVLTPEGDLASGTSTDAVVVAATGRGEYCRFGGPVSELGWATARATRRAMTAGIDRWLREHP